jgi:hypothetical protein
LCCRVRVVCYLRQVEARDNGNSLRIPYAIDTTQTVEALRGQLVASGATIGIAFLVGTSSPTVSTQLRLVRW